MGQLTGEQTLLPEAVHTRGRTSASLRLKEEFSTGGDAAEETGPATTGTLQRQLLRGAPGSLSHRAVNTLFLSQGRGHRAVWDTVLAFKELTLAGLPGVNHAA